MHLASWTCRQQVAFSHPSGELAVCARNFEVVYELFFISSCPVIAKAIIVLTVVMRNSVPASLKSSLHVKLHFPTRIHLGCWCGAPLDLTDTDLQPAFGKDLASL